MAEKNTESTAVNQLIELVATAQPLPPDPDEDLMFRPVSKPAKMEPLPRTRAPIGTQQNLQTIKQVPPGVRITTPSRSMTIPPMTLDHDEDAEVTNPGPSTFSRPTTQGFASQPPAIPTRAAGSNAARLSGVHGIPADPIASRTTRPSLPPPHPTMRASAPPPALPAPFRPSSQQTSDFSYPVVPPAPMPEPHHATSMPIVTAEDDPIASLLEPRGAEEEAATSWLEHDVGTHQVPKRADWKTMAGKLAAPMIVLVIAGIFIGGYFAFDGDGGKQRAAKPAATEGQTIAMSVTAPAAASTTPASATTPTAASPTPASATTPAAAATTPNTAASTAPASATTPAAASTPAPVTPPNLAASTPAVAKAANPTKVAPPSTGRPTLVDIRIDSSPSGATVMLIDRGKQTFLGTTPMSAAVDIARKYELVFSHEGRATVVESLDPASQKKLSVKLSRANSSSGSAPAVAAPRVAAPKVAASPKAEKAEKAAAPKAEKSAVDAAIDSADKKPAAEKPAKPEKAAKVAAAAAGDGTLMISSKPPCEIYVDGKSTGLTTPQRAIMLPTGAHKITLVNTAQGIKKTVSVQITTEKPTKVIQDFMK